MNGFEIRLVFIVGIIMWICVPSLRNCGQLYFSVKMCNVLIIYTVNAFSAAQPLILQDMKEVLYCTEVVSIFHLKLY